MTKSHIYYFLVFGLLIAQSSMADVKGQNGTLKFDSNSDGAQEMELSATGLGIGTNPSTNLHVQGNASISGTLTLGSTSSSSNLSLEGNMGLSFETLTTDGNISLNSIALIDSSSDNLAISLPSAESAPGRVYHVKKITNDNKVWLSGGDNLIDGEGRILLHNTSDILPSISLISDGSNWHITDRRGTESVIAAGNLVGWWKLDDSSGTFAEDFSGQQNHGNFEGTADFSTNVTTGVLNQAVVLEGTDDFIEIPDDSSLTFGDGTTDQPFSISVWIYPTNAAGSGGPLSKADAFDSGEYYFLMTGNDLYFRVVDHSASAHMGIAKSACINDDTWYHLVGTYDGSGTNGGLSLYINGQAQTTADSNGGTYTAMEPSGITLRLGLRNNYLEGYIDDARVYSKELTATEVQNLYLEGQ